MEKLEHDIFVLFFCFRESQLLLFDVFVVSTHVVFLFVVAELNRGLGGSSSFLWYHSNPTRGKPVVELRIIHSEAEEDCPDGFERISRDMLLGSEQCAYLCVRRGTEEDPINEIRVLYGDETQPDKGFTRLSPPIYSTSDKSEQVCLSFSSISKGT